MTSFIQKLWLKGKQAQPKEPEPGSEVKKPAEQPQGEPSETNAELKLEPPQMIAGCGQSIGQQREHNEDALFTLTTLIASDTRQIPFGFYIVADGMGGHQYGEVASAIAIRAMANYVVQKLYLPLLSIPSRPPEQSLQEIMQEGVMEAHRAILKQAPGGGTTMTAVLILGDQMTISHVGDSRAYAISSDRQVEIITRDHSLVKRLVELGQITTEEASSHPQRNVLYRALGQGEPFDPDIITAQIPDGGHLLICSDGLWGVISQEEIIYQIASNPTPYLACKKMVDAANKAGGPDNISVILVRFPGS